MIVRMRRTVTSRKDWVGSGEKQMTSQRPAAGRTCQISSPSTWVTSSGWSGTRTSDGKRFSKTTTS